jgi:uncharacterized protein (TIGR02453 family)
MFPGFPPEMLRFFRELERNNNREWFQKNKDLYESAVKLPAQALAEALNRHFFRFAPPYITDPKSAMFRIYRDTRFANDKTPYKTHAGVLFTRRGFAKKQGAAFYFSVSHKEVEIAGGFYAPMPDELRAVRRHIAAHPEEFRKLIADRKLVAKMGRLQGEQLTRPPRDFANETEAADLVRYKQWYFDAILPAEAATTPALEREVATRFERMTPFVEFLNAAFLAKGRNARAAIGPV